MFHSDRAYDRAGGCVCNVEQDHVAAERRSDEGREEETVKDGEKPGDVGDISMIRRGRRYVCSWPLKPILERRLQAMPAMLYSSRGEAV